MKQNFRLLVFILFLVACQQTQVSPLGSLAGRVIIGPLEPVVSADMPEPTVDTAVYADRQIVIFAADGRTEVTRAALDSQGNYQVDLPTGTYLVDINHIGLDRADSLPTPVTINAGETTRLDVIVDTGIRSPEPVVEAPACLEIDYALPTTEKLIASAVAMVIGTVDALSPPPVSIPNVGLPTYEATIVVEQAIRGGYAPGDLLVVAVPGNCPDQGFIQPGERVLLVLEQRPIVSNHLTLYPYGKYVLSEDGRLLSDFDDSLSTTLEELMALTGQEGQSAPSITVTEVGVSPGSRILIRGDSSLPNGTCLLTQLYLSHVPVAWWPAGQCAIVQNGRWQMSVPLDDGQAPAELDETGTYSLLAWHRDDPAAQSAIFPFDLAGPPPEINGG